MSGERARRQVQQLLDVAEEAIAVDDWDVVLRSARAALRLDPWNDDALAYYAAAARSAGLAEDRPPHHPARPAIEARVAAERPAALDGAADDLGTAAYLGSSFVASDVPAPQPAADHSPGAALTIAEVDALRERGSEIFGRRGREGGTFDHDSLAGVRPRRRRGPALAIAGVAAAAFVLVALAGAYSAGETASVPVPPAEPRPGSAEVTADVATGAAPGAAPESGETARIADARAALDALRPSRADTSPEPPGAEVTAGALAGPQSSTPTPADEAGALDVFRQPPQGSPPLGDPSEDPAPYMVQPGDTLLGIAGRLDIPLELLLEFNALDEDALLQPGQLLVIPPLEASDMPGG